MQIRPQSGHSQHLREMTMSTDSQTSSSFRLVRRGYEPIDVDRRIAELLNHSGGLQQQVVSLTSKVRELEATAAYHEAELATAPAPVPTFGDLGARVGKILELAEEEAADIRLAAKNDFEARLQEAETAAERVRREADEYANSRRQAVEAEAASLMQEARRKAEQMHDETERDSSARRAEADAVFEDQQAKAAQAAADFETTLADRRKRVEQEFAAQFDTARNQLAEAQEHLEKTRGEAQRIRSDAELGAKRVVEDAEKSASDIVAQARAHADRIKAESDRELVAATQRRDSINVQLTNVRQMLATLTNVAPADLVLRTGGLVGDAEAVAADASGEVDEVVEAAEADVDEAADVVEAVDAQDDEAAEG
jgi:cell division septum initiation protein DivIVA